MLSIYILNVGHGDSIIIEYNDGAHTVFGVIDSNRTSNEKPKALKKLNELKAKELSFIALTHPHNDHYKGLLDILEAYKGDVSTFYSFPLDHHRQGRLKELVTIYSKLYKKTDDKKIRSDLIEFIKILYHVKDSIGLDNWEEPEGFYYKLAPVGFEEVDFAAILPPKRVKGTYFQMIEKGNYDIVNRQKENDLSLAFSIRYRNRWLILGGDSPYKNWMDRYRLFSKRSGESMEANAVKLPHHGSKDNCRHEVIDYLFSNEDERIACISANGRSHPHPDVLVYLAKKGIKPFCTNLADQCGGGKPANLLVLASDLEPKFQCYLNRISEDDRFVPVQPCQGEIKIVITKDGYLTITPEFEHPCPYRGEYDFFVNLT